MATRVLSCINRPSYCIQTIKIHFHIFRVVIYLLISMFSSITCAEENSNSRTYALARNWDLHEALNRCLNNTEKSIHFSVNVECTISEDKLNIANKQAMFNNDLIKPRLTPRRSQKNVNPKITDPQHEGLVVLYRASFRGKEITKVHVYFVGKPDLPVLSSDAATILFERFANEFGLVEFSDTDDFLTMLKIATEENTRKETKAEEEKRQAKAIADELEKQRQEENKKNYVKNLKAKYSGRILSASSEAMTIVAFFDINCRAQDGRVLPLLNLLYGGIAEYERELGANAQYFLENRGKNVRIYESVSKNGKILLDRKLKYELNEWGDLRPFGIRSEAILNACYGDLGPIWKMPVGAK